MPNLEAFDAWSHTVDFAAEFVAKDIAFLELDDGAVVEMEVGAADGGAGDLEDYVTIFEDFRLRALDWRQPVNSGRARRSKGRT